MSAEFTRETAATWMLENHVAHRDPRTLEVDCTGLAEACAEAFDMADEGGPLDDPDHWIWEVAVEVVS